MTATPSPTELFLADALATEPPSEEAFYIHPADLENTNGQPSPGKRAWLTVVYLFIAAGIGAVATLAWHAHGNATREAVAPAKQISPDLEVMRQSIDALATSTATNQERMMRSIDQLASGQEQMTREITKLQEIEQSVLSKSSDQLSQPPASPMRKPVLRPSQAPPGLTPAGH
jgi:uncharacterized protein HemX